MTAYDAIVIGTGQAGPYVTSRLAGAGMKVAGIELNAFDMKAGHGPERRGLEGIAHRCRGERHGERVEEGGGGTWSGLGCADRADARSGRRTWSTDSQRGSRA